MTNATTEPTPVTREQLEAAIASAQVEVSTAQATAQEKVTAIMGTSPIDFSALASASAPVTSAETKLAKAQTTLADFLRSSRWESSAELRAPFLQAVRDIILDGHLSVPVTRVSGTITLAHEAEMDAEGKPTGKAIDAAHGSLTVTYDKIDTAALFDLLAGNLDVKALLEQDVTSIDVDVSDIGKPTATIKVLPTPAKGTTGAFKTSSETKTDARVGALEYEYPKGSGAWMGSKAMLEAVESAEPATKAKHAGSKAWPSIGGEGMSNLAKTVAKELGLESRAKE